MNVRRQAARPDFSERFLRGLRFIGRIMSVGLVLSVMAALGLAAVLAYQWLDKPIAVIAVEGNFQYIKQGEIQQLVTPKIKGGIVSLDLDQIARTLEVNPWVKQASLARQWPDGIVIKVTEETPIARWGSQGFLNSRGQILEVKDNAALQNLPLLEGPQGREYAVMKRYRELSQLLSPAQIKIQKMNLDTLGFWSLQLANGTELVFGVDDVVEKTRRFVRVRRSLPNQQAHQMAKVDLRYSNGMAVQWHPAEIALTEQRLPESNL